MTLQTIQGRGLFIPEPTLELIPPPQINSQSLIDATGEKAAFCGRVWFKERTGTKDIARVGFRFGAVTKAGGSGLTVSLQDTDTANGPPMRPDGTPDQTVAIANGDSSFATNAWYRTNTLSANRTVTYGDSLSVVIEYDGSGRLGSDSFIITSLYLQDSGHTGVSGSLWNTGSWSIANATPNVILEFTDGTFGTLEGGFPFSALNTHTFNSGSNPDEYALAFQLPFACAMDGYWFPMSVAGGTSNFDVVLYSGTTALKTNSVDANMLGSVSSRIHYGSFGSAEVLAANTLYRLAIKPTTTNNITIYSFDVADANHFTCHGGGTGFQYTTRVNAGAWASATATRRLFAGLRLSAVDDGAGGGGGGAAHLINGGLVG